MSKKETKTNFLKEAVSTYRKAKKKAKKMTKKPTENFKAAMEFVKKKKNM